MLKKYHFNMNMLISFLILFTPQKKRKAVSGVALKAWALHTCCKQALKGALCLWLWIWKVQREGKGREGKGAKEEEEGEKSMGDLIAWLISFFLLIALLVLVTYQVFLLPSFILLPSPLLFIFQFIIISISQHLLFPV